MEQTVKDSDYRAPTGNQPVPGEKQPRTKPSFTVLIGHRDCVGDGLEMYTKFELEERFDLRFVRFGDDLGFRFHHEAELVKLIETQPFDLILPYWQGAGHKLLPRLKAQYGKPIIVVSGWEADDYAPFEAASIPVLFTPVSVEDFRRALQECGLQQDAKPES
jgi:hypothetical protein